jgi:hypothetical protein
MHEALRHEAPQEAADDAVLQVELDGVFIDSFGSIKDHGADGGLTPPAVVARSLVRRGPKRIEGR